MTWKDNSSAATAATYSTARSETTAAPNAIGASHDWEASDVAARWNPRHGWHSPIIGAIDDRGWLA